MVFAVIGLHAAEPVSLFDGKTHEGWTRYGGNHDYRVEDGVIIGKLVAGEASSYLCTDKQFGDFELLFEVKYLVRSVNSGCQIRSLIRQEDGEKNFMKKGADPSEVAWRNIRIIELGDEKDQSNEAQPIESNQHAAGPVDKSSQPTESEWKPRIAWVISCPISAAEIELIPSLP